MIFTLPVGSYKVKFIWSSGTAFTVDASHLPQCFYRVDVNGVIGSPVQAGPTGFTALNNTGFNAEIDFTVDALNNGNVRIVLFSTYANYNGRPGVNLIEIVKLS